MGTRMEDYDGPRLGVVQGSQVRVNIQGLLTIVIVWEGFTMEAKSLEDLVMIGPSWIRYVDLGGGIATCFEKQAREVQATCARKTLTD